MRRLSGDNDRILDEDEDIVVGTEVADEEDKHRGSRAACREQREMNKMMTLTGTKAGA